MFVKKKDPHSVATMRVGCERATGLPPTTAVVIARMSFEEMAPMTVCRFRMAERLLALDFGFDVCVLVGEHHVGLYSAERQSTTADARRANRLAPPFPNLPDINVLDEQNGGANIVGRAHGRIRRGQTTSFESHADLLLLFGFQDCKSISSFRTHRVRYTSYDGERFC